MSKFGGGGAKCAICDKTAYPAETIQFEKTAYHVECFRCTDCSKKMEGASKAQLYEEKIYCTQCFSKNGFAQKQKQVVWTKKEEEEGGSASASKFGGGGNPCTICAKTVYPAETVAFEKKVYHVECFKCTTCAKKMSASGAAQFEDAIFCHKCFKEGGYTAKQAATTTKGATSNAMASKFGGGGNPCTICAKTVYAAETLSHEKKIYHAECFKCTECTKKMTPSSAALYKDAENNTELLLCSKCFQGGGYNIKQAKQASANAGSSGASANPMASKFGGGGTKCYVCDKTVYPAEMIAYEKKAFHNDCFKCKHCSVKVSPSGAEAKKDGDSLDVYCKKCWSEQGLNRAQLAKKEEKEEVQEVAAEVAAEVEA